MILYSKQLFFYVIEKYPHLVKKIYLSKEIEPKQWNKIKSKAPIVRIDNKKAQALAKGHNHQGYFVEIDDVPFTPFEDIDTIKETFILVLYNITDVGNIGAIIRSAYCLGVGCVILTGVRSIPTEHLIRTSVGTFFEMPVVCFKESLEVIERLKAKGFECIGADIKGDDVSKVTFGKKKVLVMGSESTGLTPKVIKKMDKMVSVVMNKPFDSLNVSCAASILIDRIR